jgi:hypothetical protein
LFADLDIDSITSQALSQSQNTDSLNAKNICGSKGTEKENCNVASRTKHTNVEKTTADTSINESQSQYFVKKFGNYRPSQPIERKEIFVDNSLTTSQSKNDTSFSFSFVGDETQVLDQTVSEIKQSVFTVTNIGPKDGNLRERKHAIQNIQGFSKCRVKDHPFSSTPYFKTEDLSVSVIDTQDLPQCSSHSQFHVPESTQCKDNSSLLDTTQLKDVEGFKYRCTPYKTKAKDLCTQSQCELMAGTQYQSYLHENYNDSQSEVTQTCDIKQSQQDVDREKVGVELTQYNQNSQISCTGLCDMTGVIIDSQKNTESKVNTSDCDIFSDSFGDENVCDKNGEMMSQEGDAGISSHTQSLNCSESSQSSQCRKSALEDDLECMIQESQNLRKTRTKVKGKSQHCFRNGSSVNNELQIKNTDSNLDNNEIVVKKNTSLQNNSVTSLGQQPSLQYGDVEKLGLQSGTKALSTIGLVHTLPTTPRVDSLQDRIKKRLKVWAISIFNKILLNPKKMRHVP